MRGIIDVIKKILLFPALAVIVFALFCLLFHYRPVVVMSGSMEPTYHTGSVVFIKEVDASQVVKGDVAAFQINESFVMHRVVDIKDGIFITKGDANNAEDPWTISEKNIKGIAQFSIPYIGFILGSLSGRKLIIVVISLLCCIVLSSFVKNTNEDIYKKRGCNNEK